MKQKMKERIKDGKYDKRILSLLAQGCTNKEICVKTGLSMYFLRSCMKNMYVKYEEPRKIPLICKVLYDKTI